MGHRPHLLRAVVRSLLMETYPSGSLSTGCDGDCLVLSAAWEVLVRLDSQSREVDTAGLSQPVIRGPSAAQGTMLSGRNQAEVLATLF